jgi:MFS family permease
MVKVKLVVAAVLAIAGVVLILISTAIAGILSTRFPDGDTKSRLRAVSALSGISAVLAIITAILGLLLAGKKSLGVKATGNTIAFIIVLVIVLIMYVVVIILTLQVRARDEVDGGNKSALTASLIITAVGFVLIAISSIVIFSIKSSITRKLKGK